ncbi:MAG: Protein TolB [Chlamydiae bacterium]|nr:Protein TolB [Chlamydiota bacterium]
MKKILLLLVLLMGLSLTFDGYCYDGELVVRLDTENQLSPMYIAPFADKNSGFSKEYVKSLEEVVHFDFDHNGMTFLVSNKETPASYQLDIKINGHKLEAIVSPPFSEEEIVIDDVLLSGQLAGDQKTLHQLADTIHRELFGTEGVASTKILYTVRTKKNGKDDSQVWEADYDGRNSRQITKDGGYCVTPSYVSPMPGYAAGSFFYVSYETGQPKIYVASLSDGVGRRFSALSGNQLMPAISRQRDQVAFISDVTGNPDLFLQEFSPEEGVQEKPRHLFTAPLATQGSPAFSPDGTRVAFVSNKGGSPRIYILRTPPRGTPLKETSPVLITKFNSENTAPAWSPDGTKLAYCSKTKGIRQIWVYDFLNGIERQLTQGTGNKENPTWAPNSLHLIYNTSDAKASELYLINLKQGKAIKISSGPGEKRFPSWEPTNAA